MQNLRHYNSNELATHYFSAVLDIADENFDDADAEITAAEQKGLAKDLADKLRAAGVSSHKLKIRIIYIAGIILFAWIAGIAVLYLAGTALSKSTLRELERLNPGTKTSQSELRIRRIYRGVVNFSSIYYEDASPQKKGVDQLFRDSLTRQTSEFDSHPSPIDRFRYVANMVGDAPALEGQIWDLFADRSAIVSEMSVMILKSIPDLNRTVATGTASS